MTANTTYQFRCTAITERVAGVGQSEWHVTFAPLVSADGTDNLYGGYGAFTIYVAHPDDAGVFKVGQLYDFDISVNTKRR